MKKICHVYILTNKYKKVLYTGVTSDIIQRVWQHREKQNKGFTKRYNVDKLVYVEEHDTIDNAIMREKQIKAGSRAKKLALIEELNPDWRDLFEDLLP